MNNTSQALYRSRVRFWMPKVFMAGGLSLLMSQVAFAQQPSPTGQIAQMERREPARPMQDIFRDNIGVSVALGASEFIDGAIRDKTDTGVSWDVRVLWGSRAKIGVEAAYIGSSYEITGPEGQTTELYGNGLETSIRMNLMQVDSTMPAIQTWQPYLLGGVAWKNYQVSDTIEDVNLKTSDDTLEVPVAAGLSFYFPNNFMIDARAAYRLAFASNLVREGDGNLDNWNVTGRIGWMF